MGTRGRPSSKPIEQPLKFVREYIDSDGIITRWKYDLTKTKNGPIEVEAIYPKDYFKKEKKQKT